MLRKFFSPLSGGQITFLVGLAIIAPSAVYGAATFTKVVLQDAQKDYFASVDRAGRLATLSSPTLSTIASTGNFFNSGTTYVTSPTTADIAITQVKISETRLNGTAVGSDLFVMFAQFDASAGGCTTAIVRNLATISIQSGDIADVLSPAAPLLVTPAGGAQYCLGFVTTIYTGGADVTPYYPTYSMTAYVERGRYAGSGAAGAAGAPTAPQLLAKKAH